MANDSMKKELVAHKVYSAWQFITYTVIIPGLSEPPVRTLRATIPENESHIFR